MFISSEFKEYFSEYEHKNIPHMKRLIYFLMVLLLSGCYNTNDKLLPSSIEQENLVLATIWYQKSPEVKALYHQGFNIARERVLEYKTIKGTKPKAVIVDLDETMINNSLYQGRLIKTGEYYTQESWKEWSNHASATALPGAVEFTLFCDSVGVEIIYLSNRMTTELESTMRNLDSLGFAFIRSENFFLKSDVSGKEKRREKVSEIFDIILLLGDNLNDFSDVFENRGDDWGTSIVEKYKDDFGRRFIIFPNPMYGEWEKNIYSSYDNRKGNKGYKLRREKVNSF